eukprot:gene1578-3051_t
MTTLSVIFLFLYIFVSFPVFFSTSSNSNVDPVQFVILDSYGNRESQGTHCVIRYVPNRTDEYPDSHHCYALEINRELCSQLQNESMKNKVKSDISRSKSSLVPILFLIQNLFDSNRISKLFKQIRRIHPQQIQFVLLDRYNLLDMSLLKGISQNEYIHLTLKDFQHVNEINLFLQILTDYNPVLIISHGVSYTSYSLAIASGDDNLLEIQHVLPKASIILSFDGLLFESAVHYNIPCIIIGEPLVPLDIVRIQQQHSKNDNVDVDVNVDGSAISTSTGAERTSSHKLIRPSSLPSLSSLLYLISPQRTVVLDTLQKLLDNIITNNIRGTILPLDKPIHDDGDINDGGNASEGEGGGGSGGGGGRSSKPSPSYNTTNSNSYGSSNSAHYDYGYGLVSVCEVIRRINHVLLGTKEQMNEKEEEGKDDGNDDCVNSLLLCEKEEEENQADDHIRGFDVGVNGSRSNADKRSPSFDDMIRTNDHQDEQSVTIIMTVYKRNTSEMQLKALLNQTAAHRIRSIIIYQDKNYIDLQFLKDSIKVMNRQNNNNNINNIPIHFIHSKTKNFKYHGRFAAALLLTSTSTSTSAYVMIMDDDTVPQCGWLALALETSQIHNAVVGPTGMVLSRDQQYVVAPPTDYDMEVDYVGHCWLFRSDWVRYLWRDNVP